MAQTLSTLSIISFVIAGVSLAAAILFWFFFKIPAVIGDLSGKTAKKSIAKMRAANEKTGNKSYRSSETNVGRGKLTETMDFADKGKAAGGRPAPKIHKPTVAAPAETSLLDENKAVYAGAETELLGADADETVLLAETPVQSAARVGGVQLTVVEIVEFIHTNEVI